MDRYDAARKRQARPGRSTLGYWVPLVVTLTIATAGLAAWIWSERQQDDDDDDDLNYDHPVDYPEQTPDSGDQDKDSSSFLTRVSRRAPSPQQFFDSAGQRIRAVVGLSNAPADGPADAAFSDHERWNEEADIRRSQQLPAPLHTTSSKRTVALVLSADSDRHHHHDSDTAEYTSILSHLQDSINPACTNLFVLIYTPNQTSLPPLPTTSTTPSTLSSSYASVSYPSSPDQSSPSSPLFDALWQKSLALVNKPSQVLPFSTSTGYIHILRHLSPSMVYLVDTPLLSGRTGEHINQLKAWVGQTILVVGDDAAGGLLDTDTEDETRSVESSQRNWWEHSDMIGLGKHVEVVDIQRVAEDWSRRVGSTD